MPLRAKVTSGPVPGGPGGWCGGRAVGSVTPGVDRRQRAEQLGVDARRRRRRARRAPSRMSVMNAAGPQRYAVASAGRPSRPARPASGVRGDRDRRPVLGVGRAVEDVLVRVRQRCEQRVRLGGEGVLARSAGAVDPPDLAVAAARRRAACSMASTGVTPMPAEIEQHRAGAVGRARTRRAARRRRGSAPGRSAVVQVAADDAVRLALDADPVACRRRARRTASSCAPAAGSPAPATRSVRYCPARAAGSGAPVRRRPGRPRTRSRSPGPRSVTRSGRNPAQRRLGADRRGGRARAVGGRRAARGTTAASPGSAPGSSTARAQLARGRGRAGRAARRCRRRSARPGRSRVLTISSPAWTCPSVMTRR